jgi:hypothetical protein
MKRTDQERIERELKRREKHARVGGASTPGDSPAAAPERGTTVSDYIKNLVALFEYDDHQIYNTRDDENVLELLLDMKAALPEKNWDTVLKSAIQKTKVEEKELALSELKALMAD